MEMTNEIATKTIDNFLNKEQLSLEFLTECHSLMDDNLALAMNHLGWIKDPELLENVKNIQNIKEMITLNISFNQKMIIQKILKIYFDRYEYLLSTITITKLTRIIKSIDFTSNKVTLDEDSFKLVHNLIYQEQAFNKYEYLSDDFKSLVDICSETSRNIFKNKYNIK